MGVMVVRSKRSMLINSALAELLIKEKQNGITIPNAKTK